MNRLLFTLLCLLTVSTTACSQPDSSSTPGFLVDENIPASLAEAMLDFPDSTELALALIDADGTVRFYGCRRSMNHLQSVRNQDAIFQIGSISKVFTATSLAQMVVDGQLQLSDTINAHFNFPFRNDQRITFQELATHSSGLARMPSNFNSPHYQDPFRDYDAAHLESFLAEKMNLQDKAYSYSNLGAGLLGFTLAKIRGSTYNEMLEALVTKPLNLPHTGQFAHLLWPAYQVTGRGAYGKITPNWNFDALAGAGALFSSTNDLSRFILAHLDPKNEALALTRQPRLKVNDNYSLGLGWHILHQAGRNDWYWHNGAVGGFVSSMVFDPERQIGVVVLSNVSAYHEAMGKIDQLCFGFMEQQLED